jgi:hypothetical protein
VELNVTGIIAVASCDPFCNLDRPTIPVILHSWNAIEPHAAAQDSAIPHDQCYGYSAQTLHGRCRNPGSSMPAIVLAAWLGRRCSTTCTASLPVKFLSVALLFRVCLGAVLCYKCCAALQAHLFEHLLDRSKLPASTQTGISTICTLRNVRVEGTYCPCSGGSPLSGT